MRYLLVWVNPPAKRRAILQDLTPFFFGLIVIFTNDHVSPYGAEYALKGSFSVSIKELLFLIYSHLTIRRINSVLYLKNIIKFSF